MSKFYFSFILLFVFFANAQKKQGQALVDSLLVELPKVKEDTTKTIVFNQLSHGLLYINQELSLKYCEKAFYLSKKINYREGIAYSYLNKGIYYTMISDFNNAFHYFNSALKYTKNIKTIRTLYSEMAIAYDYQANYSMALEYNNKALKILESLNHNEDAITNTLTNIGIIYFELENYTKSLEYYNKAFEMNKKVNSNTNNASIYCNSGFCYSNLKQYNSAIENFKKAIIIAEKEKNQSLLSYCLGGLGSVYFKKKEYDLAIKNLEESIKISNLLGDQYSVATNLNEIANVNLELAKSENNPIKRQELLSKTELTLQKSRTINIKTNSLKDLYNNYNLLSEVQHLQGRDKEAYENHKLYTLYKDSIYNETNKETIKNLEDKRTIEIKEKENQLDKIKLQTKEKQKWYLIGGIFLLGIIGGLLFYQNRNRKKTNEKLQLLNSELDKANKIKARFFAILNHDLRSPVYNLIHFLQLQKESPELLDYETKKNIENSTLAGAENLLVSMEDMLLWSKGQMENFKPKFENISVNKLFEDTQKHFNSEEKIKIIFENPQNIELNTDENYLKTIMRNLTGNAIKALHNRNDGQIIWKAYQKNNQNYLIISDNGSGANSEQLKALYDENEVVGIKSGLGLHLIRDIAKSINCEISVDSKINSGTIVTLKL